MLTCRVESKDRIYVRAVRFTSFAVRDESRFLNTSRASHVGKASDQNESFAILPLYYIRTHCCAVSHAASGSSKLDGLKITQQFFLARISLRNRWRWSEILKIDCSMLAHTNVSNAGEEASFHRRAFSMGLHVICGVTFVLYQGNRMKCFPVNFYLQLMVFGGDSVRRWIYLGSLAHFSRSTINYLSLCR